MPPERLEKTLHKSKLLTMRVVTHVLFLQDYV